MKRELTLACVLIGMTVAAHAKDYSVLGDWPVTWTTDSGYEYGFKGIYQYDLNNFFGDARDPETGGPLFEDANTWRSKELDFNVSTPIGLKLHLGYDFQNGWAGNYLAFESEKAGIFRLGQIKTQVGWAATESLAAQTFMEDALSVSAIYEGRRIGGDWTYANLTHWRFTVGGYTGGDLNGDNDGHGYSGRIVYAPIQTDTDVLHLGLSGSRELPDDEIAKIGTTPEAALTNTELVTTSSLTDTDAIDRAGLEGGWMHGPFFAQGEYLRINAQRTAGQPDFTGTGFYVFGTWMLTGESRVYKDSYFVNTKPSHKWGAIELAARYSEIDLADGSVQGGKEHNWAVGVNWYIGQHFKLQADYIWARASNSPANNYLAPVDPRIFEMRAQMYF